MAHAGAPSAVGDGLGVGYRGLVNMRTTVATIAALGVLVSGCAGIPLMSAPTPTPTPTSSATASGAEGKRELRLVPAPAELTCRELGPRETPHWKRLAHPVPGKPSPKAVDIGEGWAVVASWGDRFDGSPPEIWGFYTNGEQFAHLPDTWDGEAPLARLAFRAGPEAARKVVACIS